MKQHWEQVLTSKSESEMSWTQMATSTPRQLIGLTGLDKTAAIIDVGGGVSNLVDALISRGFSSISVLDISPKAIEKARSRLKQLARGATWIAGDITEVKLSPAHYNIWHDRAVFHFLTNIDQRKRYVAQLKQALTPTGFVIMATFSLKGPDKCSGLDVVRYSAASMQNELGTEFKLLKTVEEAHTTPWGAPQQFIYCLFQRG